MEGGHLTVPIQSGNERVASAQQKLQQSSEELAIALKEYAAKFKDFPNIGGEFAAAALASRPGEIFGQIIGQLLAHQKNQKETVSRRVGDCMAKVFPVMRLALGVIATGPDVCQHRSVMVASHKLIWRTGYRIFDAYESDCQLSRAGIISTSILKALCRMTR
jgi:hypothetical protein